MRHRIESPANQEIIIKIIFFLSYASFSAWLSFYNIFLKTYAGFNDSQVGIISGIQQINILLVLPVWGILADKFGRRRMMLIALFVTLCLFYGFLFQKL
jgi:MFS family permease